MHSAALFKELLPVIFFPHSFQGVLSERVRGKEREQLEFLIQLECSKRVIKITLPVITI